MQLTEVDVSGPITFHGLVIMPKRVRLVEEFMALSTDLIVGGKCKRVVVRGPIYERDAQYFVTAVSQCAKVKSREDFILKLQYLYLGNPDDNTSSL